MTDRPEVPAPADYSGFSKAALEQSIASLFEQTVETYPDRIAAKCEKQRLTYRELNEAANRIAYAILALKPYRSLSNNRLDWERHAEPVAVFMEPGIESLLAAFGLLKAGKLFVSIDPNDPKTRNGYILRHAPAYLILTNTRNFDFANKLAPPECKVINVEQLSEQAEPSNPQLPISPWDPALLLYTSGSTGQPKGIVDSQRDLLHDIKIKTELMKISPSDQVSLLAWGTGQAIKTIFSTLLNGATLSLFNLKREGIAPLPSWIKQERISLLTISSPIFRSLLSILPEDEAFPDLRVVRTASDVIYPEDIRRAKEHLSAHCFFINALASNETGTICAHVMSQSSTIEGTRVPIGSPVDDTQLSLLDEHGKPVQDGSLGAIAVTSRYITRAYWRRPDLSHTAFTHDPQDPELVTFKSADLARLRPDGLFELAGRRDFQVKVRGYRVDTVEVEAALLSHENISEAVVQPFEGTRGEKRLVGYLVAEKHPAPTTSFLHQFLKEKVTDYMIPSAFVVLDEIPLLPTGKTNRRALPAPSQARPQLDEAYAAPRTSTEEMLAEIWSNVIGIDEVGIHDPFMELGGDSLKAGQVMARIIEAFGIDLPLRILLESSTIAAIATTLEKHARSAVSKDVPAAIERIPGPGPWELSFGQTRMWFFHQLYPDSTAYNMPKPIRLSGKLNVGALTEAIECILSRHEVLRTNYPTVEGVPKAIVMELPPLELPVIDLRKHPAALREEELQRLIAAETVKPFDLERDLKLRCTLYQLDEAEHVLLCLTHHIASDGWSRGILIRELVTHYQAMVVGEPSPLEPLPIQYSDFARWQLEKHKMKESRVQMEYWMRRLHNIPPSLDLPTDRPRPAVKSSQASTFLFTIPQDQTRALTDFAKQEHVTLFMLLLACFNTLLYRYTKQEDVVVGCPVAGRGTLETEDLIGFFVNSLVMRNDLSGNPGFRELLDRVREQALGAYAHPDVPFEKLVDQIKPGRDTGRNPLFQILFDVHRPRSSGLRSGELSFELATALRTETPFDQAWNIAITEAGLLMRIQYATDLFDQSTIERMAGHFQTLLKGVVEAPDTPIDDLPILSPSEKQKMLVDWNDTARNYSPHKCLHEWFEDQAQHTPKALAAIYENYTLSYEDLNRRANQLAHYLIKRGVRRETLVGLCIDRSLEMLVAMLGILKAGGAFVPLDPGLPQERLNMLIEDAGLTFIVVARLEEHFSVKSSSIFIPMAQVNAQPNLEPVNLSVKVSLEDPAYVLYTSGSTGRPKAVLVEHRQWLNYVHGVVEQYAMEEPGVFAMLQPLTVDSSQTMIFPALIHGSTIHIFSKDHSLDATRLADTFERIRVDYLKIAPSHLWALLSVEQPERLLPRRHLIVGGESFHWKNLDRLYQLNPQCQIWNHYGPTETTVGVLTFRIDKSDSQYRTLSATVPIGRPLANVRCYVLDPRGKPVPLGLPGELYLGGDSVVRGYLNRPDLTKQGFVEDPFSESPESRLYRTGDIVRWLPDGVLEFLGREDSQVKLRGYRIELGEIESVLGDHPHVSQAAVLLREDDPDDPYIAAYLVPNNNKTLTTGEVQQYLKAQLPEFMIPSAMVFMDEIPLTQHGKADRKALPKPDLSLAVEECDPARQGSVIEEEIASVWREILNVKRVGFHDSFFRIGGHSLSAMRIIALLNKKLRIELQVRDIFDHPTIEGLAERIVQLGGEATDTPRGEDRSVDGKFDERMALSFAQKRLWFLHQVEEALTAYNMPGCWRLEGALQVEVLRQALEAIVARHQPLRTVFESHEGQPLQVICPPQPFKLPIHDLTDLPRPEQEDQARHLAREEAAKPFDLSNDLMLRASLLRLSEAEHQLLLTQHHIASDGWSEENLWKELQLLYNAIETGGSPAPLPDLPSSYAEYAEWQRETLQGARREQLTGYWRNQLKDLRPVILPTVHPYPEEANHLGADLEFRVEADLVAKLQTLCVANVATPQMLLLAAFQSLLSRYSGQDDIVIGVPFAGRLKTEYEALIGFFVNSVLIRGDLSGDPSFIEFLKRIQETSFDAYEHQELPFDMLVEELQPARNLDQNPLFQVMFQFSQIREGKKYLGNVKATHIRNARTTTHFDMEMHFGVEDNTWRGRLGYRTDLFKPETMQRLASHFLVLLEGIVVAPETPISQLPLLSEKERWQLLGDWSGASSMESQPEKCLFDLFEEQVLRTPDAVALVHENNQFTYQELNNQANRLARHLQSIGVGSNTPVGIWADRSPEMLMSILGILKAGACYLPLDPTYPASRLTYMVSNSQAPFILSLKDSAEAIPAEPASLIHLEDVLQNQNQSVEVTDEELKAKRSTDPKTLAYVIYTSGSTGKPKGVAMPHASLVNLVNWQQASSLSGRKPRTLQYSSLSFDVSFQEIFSTWCAGGTLVMVEEETRRDFNLLWDHMYEAKIERLFMPYVALQMLALVAEASAKKTIPTNLKEIITAGEQLQITPEIKQLFELLPGCRLCNQYGPTETHVVTSYPLPESPETWPALPPIGRPITNAVVRILDDKGQPVPVGITGELFIGGLCLARGYLNNPTLAQETFKRDPFDRQEGRLLYQSGDLARWQTDGNIEFLGRRDSQFKLRGYRIEPSEIEAQLAQHPSVRQCVVVGLADKHDKTSKQLVAYLVLADDRQSVNVNELKSQLKQTLPEFLIPNSFVILESLPLGPTGKMDRCSLPGPEISGRPLTEDSATSCSSTESIVSKIMTEFLNIDGIGLNESFFDAGGHSMLAMRVMARIHSVFHIDVRIRDLFDKPTVAELASLIDTKCEEMNPPG